MPLEGVNSRIRESAISETDLLTMSSGSSGSKVALPAPVLRSIFCLIRRIVLSGEGLEDAGCEDNYIVDEKGKYNDSHTSGMVRACPDLAGLLGKGTKGLYIIAISLLHCIRLLQTPEHQEEGNDSYLTLDSSQQTVSSLNPNICLHDQDAIDRKFYGEDAIRLRDTAVGFRSVPM